MPDTVSIATAAHRTQLSQRRIREWCATGSLACERRGADWRVPARELERIDDLAASEDEALSEQRVGAIALPEPVDVGAAMARLARGVGQTPAAITVERLALDGRAYLVFAWPSPRETAGLRALGAWARRIGGVLLERAPDQ